METGWGKWSGLSVAKTDQPVMLRTAVRECYSGY